VRVQGRPVRLDEAAEGDLVASARRVEQPPVGAFGYGRLGNLSGTGAGAIMNTLSRRPGAQPKVMTAGS
jgi:hypothetical protein